MNIVSVFRECSQVPTAYPCVQLRTGSIDRAHSVMLVPGPRRTDGCLGYAGRLGAVSQSNSRKRAGACQSIDPHAGISHPTALWSRFGFASRPARGTAPLASGRRQPWADSRSHTWKAWPSTTGRAMAPGSPTTRPDQEIHCLFPRAAGDPAIGPSSRRRRVSTLTFPYGRPAGHSFTSTWAPFRTN